MPDVVVTRRTHFNAAHRLFDAALSEADNRALFGLDADLHGHNYNLDVSVIGPIDPRTGYVLDINVLKRLVEEHVLCKLDHKYLNDLPEFRTLIPSAEHIVLVCWRWLAPAIPRGRLYKLVLWETERNFVEYMGG